MSYASLSEMNLCPQIYILYYSINPALPTCVGILKIRGQGTFISEFSLHSTGGFCGSRK